MTADRFASLLGNARGRDARDLYGPYHAHVDVVLDTLRSCDPDIFLAGAERVQEVKGSPDGKPRPSGALPAHQREVLYALSRGLLGGGHLGAPPRKVVMALGDASRALTDPTMPGWLRQSQMDALFAGVRACGLHERDLPDPFSAFPAPAAA